MKFKKIAKVIAFLLILLICFETVNYITKRKYAYEKMADFFEQEEDFDVLFFGTSHIYRTICPMQLWDDYGMISYNMGQTSASVAICYYNLLLSQKYTSPKLIVIDTYNILDNDKIFYYNISNSMHYTFDAYPLSKLKYEAIKDLWNNEDMQNHYAEYLFTFPLYHSRWSALTKDDFVLNKNKSKGTIHAYGVAEPYAMSDVDSVKAYSGKESINIEYLRKMIEYCKENDIDIIVTYTPFPAKDYYIAESKFVKTVCDEYDVDYINFLEMDVVNYNIDCSDESSHLNPSGARKVTDYLGKYIKENYNIPDQRTNEKYDFWNEDYNEYVDFKIKELARQGKDRNSYISLLYYEKDIGYKIQVSSKLDIEADNILKQLLENINNNYEINDEVFSDNAEDKTIKITTYDNRTGELLSELYF